MSLPSAATPFFHNTKIKKTNARTPHIRTTPVLHRGKKRASIMKTHQFGTSTQKAAPTPHLSTRLWWRPSVALLSIDFAAELNTVSAVGWKRGSLANQSQTTPQILAWGADQLLSRIVTASLIDFYWLLVPWPSKIDEKVVAHTRAWDCARLEKKHLVAYTPSMEK